jgi:hypothetical protein
MQIFDRSFPKASAIKELAEKAIANIAKMIKKDRVLFIFSS